MRRRRPSNQLISLALLLAFGTASCRSSTPPTKVGAPGAHDKVLLQLANLPPGLQIRLSNGRPEASRGEVIKRPAATKLVDADVARLFARLPALAAAAG